ncbi:xylanase [Coprinopsis sp. MPI-PUGE-AT-0042]|nr:xylanase [Coprinopsis sp. MPI-PUGE-AT-0042]KAH6910581.1 xylanase [Coprinopsis sp. MPI-PUGE-AT-0042]
MKFSSLVVAAAAAIGALATPVVNSTEHGLTLLSARAGTPSSEGNHGGYFYSWWTDNQGTAYYTNQNGGAYNLQWSGNGNLVGGKGWNPGTWGRVINYSGTYQPNGNSYLAVYGWTRNALIEYYVVESYGSYNPSSAAQKKGTVNCNGANYDVLQTTRTNQPSIDGTKTFQQFWSVRNPKKNPGGQISGTVDTGCHFNAWKNFGMQLGSSHYYQIVATEGYFSSGSATISVS